MTDKETLIDHLKANYPQSVSLASLAHLTRQSQQGCSACIEDLKKAGYPLQTANDTVTLELPLIYPPAIIERLKDSTPKMIIHFERSLPSTNTTALSSLDQSESDTLVLTDHQTEGKGRLGRRWRDVSGKSVAFSLILKPAVDHSEIPLFTQLAAAALYQTLATHGDVKIKWPNDLILNGKKVAGILTESQFSGSRLSGIVIGIGINSNKSIEDFDTSLRNKATSLRIETDEITDPNTLVSTFLNHFYTLYADWLRSDDPSGFLHICRSHSLLIGREIKVLTDSDHERTATVRDINKSGELVVQYSGEASLETLRSLNYSIRGVDGYV